MYTITIANHSKIKKLKLHFNFIRKIFGELHRKKLIIVFGRLFFELYYSTNSCRSVDHWTIVK